MGFDYCFLDKERPCEAKCKGYNKKSEDCKLLERSGTISRSLKVLMHWLRQANVPKIG